MPLTLTLKPYEMLVINGARIRNGNSQTKLTFENECRMLRETELMPDLQPQGALDNLAMRAQELHLTGDVSKAADVQTALDRCRQEGVLDAQKAQEIWLLLETGETHKAFRACRALTRRN